MAEVEGLRTSRMSDLGQDEAGANIERTACHEFPADTNRLWRHAQAHFYTFSYFKLAGSDIEKNMALREMKIVRFEDVDWYASYLRWRSVGV